jgi:hypothetical protein
MDPNHRSSHGAAADAADAAADASTNAFGNVPTTIRKTTVLDVMRRSTQPANITVSANTKSGSYISSWNIIHITNVDPVSIHRASHTTDTGTGIDEVHTVGTDWHRSR